MGRTAAESKAGSNIGKAVKRGILTQGKRTKSKDRSPIRLTEEKSAALTADFTR